MFGKTLSGVLPAALIALVLSGCSSETQESVEVAGPPPEVEADEHAGHDHGPLGPNGGHLLHLEPTGAHAEWVHLDDEELIQVFLDEELGEVQSVVMVIEVEGQDPQQLELAADESLGEGGYSIKSATLLNAIKMGEAAQVELQVTGGETTYSAVIEHHEH